MNYKELDTPALIIDREIMLSNIKFMQDYANEQNVNLRPHTKTHKMSEIAKLQVEHGAQGIAVAKVGEAEVMAANGIDNILIANEIVGDKKLQRIRKLAETTDVQFGLDSIAQAEMIERNFEGAEKKAQVVIEIEVGENRSGIIEEKDFLDLLDYIKQSKNLHLRGVFSHDGDSYGAADVDELREIHMTSQKRTLDFANLAKEQGFELDQVGIGSTPSLMHGFPILEGITEIRPGTYIFWDQSMANAYGSYERNAATVLATVMSTPTDERVILDVGAKGLTAQSRSKGVTANKGLGLIKGWKDVEIFDVYDEHAIIYNKGFRDDVKVGDKVEVIMNHICPVVNLYHYANLVEGGKLIKKIKIDAQGQIL